jgi:transcriptional regulator with XRE-family HTH domain
MSGGRPSGRCRSRVVLRGLHDQRVRLGISVADMLEALEERGVKISRSTLYFWECGRSGPMQVVIPALCEILEVTEEELVSGR